MKKYFAFALLALSSLWGCNQSQPSDSSSPEKPLVVFVTGDHEYSSEETMPLLAAELEKNYRVRTRVLRSYPDHNAEEDIPGLEVLDSADLAVFFLRWRRLPADQLKYIDDYLNSGKPVMGFRTSTHAFNYPEGHLLQHWNAFGERAFGAPPGWGGAAGHTHYGHESSTEVFIAMDHEGHPILTGIEPRFSVRSWLYKVLPDYPAQGSNSILMGNPVNPNTPDAFENPVAWTWTSASGARTFMTTLGHPDDFRQESVQRLCINAIHWTLGIPVPEEWKGPIEMNVEYHGIQP